MGEYAEYQLQWHMSHPMKMRPQGCRCLKCKREIKSAKDVCGEADCPVKTVESKP